MTQEFDDTAKKFLLEILSVHEGEENRISKSDLIIQLTTKMYGASLHLGFWDEGTNIVSNNHVGERKMRDLLTEIRMTFEGRWIVSHPAGGYFKIQNNDLDELEKYLAPDEKAGVSAIVRINTQKKNAGLEVHPSLQMIMELEI